MLSIDQAVNITKSIINHQQMIIGPLAMEQAKKVNGIQVSNDGTITVTSKNISQIIENLVVSYQHIFGQASVEACKDAIKESQLSLSPSDLPEILR